MRHLPGRDGCLGWSGPAVSEPCFRKTVRFRAPTRRRLLADGRLWLRENPLALSYLIEPAPPPVHGIGARTRTAHSLRWKLRRRELVQPRRDPGCERGPRHASPWWLDLRRHQSHRGRADRAVLFGNEK